MFYPLNYGHITLRFVWRRVEESNLLGITPTRFRGERITVLPTLLECARRESNSQSSGPQPDVLSVKLRAHFILGKLLLLAIEKLSPTTFLLEFPEEDNQLECLLIFFHLLGLQSSLKREEK